MAPPPRGPRRSFALALVPALAAACAPASTGDGREDPDASMREGGAPRDASIEPRPEGGTQTDAGSDAGTDAAAIAPACQWRPGSGYSLGLLGAGQPVRFGTSRAHTGAFLLPVTGTPTAGLPSGQTSWNLVRLDSTGRLANGTSAGSPGRWIANETASGLEPLLATGDRQAFFTRTGTDLAGSSGLVGRTLTADGAAAVRFTTSTASVFGIEESAAGWTMISAPGSGSPRWLEVAPNGSLLRSTTLSDDGPLAPVRLVGSGGRFALVAHPPGYAVLRPYTAEGLSDGRPVPLPLPAACDNDLFDVRAAGDRWVVLCGGRVSGRARNLFSAIVRTDGVVERGFVGTTVDGLMPLDGGALAVFAQGELVVAQRTGVPEQIAASAVALDGRITGQQFVLASAVGVGAVTIVPTSVGAALLGAFTTGTLTEVRGVFAACAR